LLTPLPLLFAIVRFVPKTAALIPAAGSGERLGKGPKALLPLGEKTMLEYSLQAFTGLVDNIIIAVSGEMLPQLPRHIAQHYQIIQGGADRQETVLKLLQTTEAETVLIHDAARPFLSRAIVSEIISVVSHSGAATTARSVADTLIDVRSSIQPEREHLRAIQTPQGFWRELILRAHRVAHKDNFQATDDAALVRRIGHPVELVEGSAWLMKVTTAADYEIAQALAGVWCAHT
jgi:2-C-methyl-D-erythritol 4-phosphate cytidylyltransferase